MGITAPLDEAQRARLGWRERIPFNDSRQATYYLGLSRDGRVRIGGGPPGYGFNDRNPPPVPPQPHLSALRSELERIFPMLAPVRFERTWCGAVDCSLDFKPAVVRLGAARSIYAAIGYSGQGVNLTSVHGRMIAELIAGQGESWRGWPYLDRMPPYVPNEPLRWLGIHAAFAALS